MDTDASLLIRAAAANHLDFLVRLKRFRLAGKAHGDLCITNGSSTRSVAFHRVDICQQPNNRLAVHRDPRVSRAGPGSLVLISVLGSVVKVHCQPVVFSPSDHADTIMRLHFLFRVLLTGALRVGCLKIHRHGLFVITWLSRRNSGAGLRYGFWSTVASDEAFGNVTMWILGRQNRRGLRDGFWSTVASDALANVTLWMLVFDAKRYQ